MAGTGRRRTPVSVSAGLAVRPGAVGPPTPFARRVLDVVERIPAGSVMTYGDVAEYLGAGSPRSVGNVLSQYGREVPWQRVVLSTGEVAPAYVEEALRLLGAEGCPLRAEDRRVDLARARWDGR
ncbi:MAG: MGMT family protein [Mycobacteriales bacterium]